MTDCQKTRADIHDYNDYCQGQSQDTNLDTLAVRKIDQHLSECLSCETFYKEYQQLQSQLKELPRPVADFGLKQKIIVKRHGVQRRKRSIRAYASAAAVAFIAIMIGFYSLPTTTQYSDNPLILAEVNQPSPVNFLVNAEHAVDNVTFSLTAPENMELYGYPGQHTLSWSGRLKQGKNLLSVSLLPSKELTGTLVMTIKHKKSSKEYKVNVDARIRKDNPIT